MKTLHADIIQFFSKQGFVVVSTIDGKGKPHNSCKGIVDIDSNGRVYLFDLYRAQTHDNLKNNPHMSITAVDEHKFVGYTLKGTARIDTGEALSPRLLKAWGERITSRLTQRIVRNLREEKGHPRHPEVLLPDPKYLINMEVEEVVDLTPHHLKENRHK
jgi:hypothetical protein